MGLCETVSINTVVRSWVLSDEFEEIAGAMRLLQDGDLLSKLVIQVSVTISYVLIIPRHELTTSLSLIPLLISCL
jgi:hypothetical protein